MITAPPTSNEKERLEMVAKLAATGSANQQAWDDIVRLASLICEVPMALVSIIDDTHQWSKSTFGMPAGENPRESTFCSHAILEPDEIMIVPDATQDMILSSYPSVTAEPGIRFYAGVPLRAQECALGTLCVIDFRPRALTSYQLEALTILGRMAERILATLDSQE